MYAHNPNSRIAREFFFILNALRDHYRTLRRMGENESIRGSNILVLLAIYMLREEGVRKFRPIQIVNETGLPRSSVYEAVTRLFEEGVLEEEYGEYVCLSRTPDFLTNPKELYERPLTTVKGKDYDIDDKIQQALRQILPALKEEMKAELEATQIVRTPPPVQDAGRFTQPTFKTPSMTIDELKEELNIKKKEKKEGDEEEENEVEEELGAFFM